MHKLWYRNIYFTKGDLNVDNLDINKLLQAISKMDKAELEKNIYKAKQILDNSDIKKNFDQKQWGEYERRFFRCF